MTVSKGVVVPPGGGKHLAEASGQVVSMKLFGRDTAESVTLFEQAVPAGSRNSWLHLHRDSDEIAWVLEGEFTFKIGETVTTGKRAKKSSAPQRAARLDEQRRPAGPRRVPLHPGHRRTLRRGDGGATGRRRSRAAAGAVRLGSAGAQSAVTGPALPAAEEFAHFPHFAQPPRAGRPRQTQQTILRRGDAGPVLTVPQGWRMNDA